MYSYVDGMLPSPFEFLANTLGQPPKPNPAYALMKRTDQLVLNVLFFSLSNSILGHVLSSTTARDLWNSLASMFSSHSNAKEFQI